MGKYNENESIENSNDPGAMFPRHFLYKLCL